MTSEDLKGEALAAMIVIDIRMIDKDLDVKHLAKAVAKVIETEYGQHNIEPFIKAFNEQLNIKG